MSVLNCMKCGFTFSQTFCTKLSIRYTRQCFILGYQTNKTLGDGVRYPTGWFRCLATKARIRPRPRTAEDEKKKKTGNKMRTFFVSIFPQAVANIVAIVVVIFAIGLVQSVKENAKVYYSKSRLGVYKETFTKCSHNSKVTSLLGEPVREVTVNGKPEKVQITETTVENLQHIKMQFNIEGSQNTGTVYLQGTKGEEEDFQTIYLYVKVGDEAIIIEDNR